MINWVGNKIKYIEQIKSLTKDFKIVADGMMGSGNVLIELAKTHEIIGNDCIKLMPAIYNNFDNFEISENGFFDILNQWNCFEEKEYYYKFRDYWNKKYLENRFNSLFLLETFLLLKMCSNSMVRFNSKGEFNQGFRGCNGPFFKNPQVFKRWTDELINIALILKKSTTSFYTSNINYFLRLNEFKDLRHTVFIFDPPYVLANGMYSNTFTEETERDLIFNIQNKKLNFIYFNFEERERIVNGQIRDFAKQYKVIPLNSKSAVGQNRKKTSNVKEILITNIV